jgi:hypothetical protein
LTPFLNRNVQDAGEKSKVVDGIAYNTFNCAQIDVKIPFDQVENLEGLKLAKLVSQHILNGLDQLKSPKKLHKFDFPTFKEAFERHLKAGAYLD